MWVVSKSGNCCLHVIDIFFFSFFKFISSHETETKNSDLNVEDTLMEGLKHKGGKKSRAEKLNSNSILPQVNLDQVICLRDVLW